jgi:hypothetical protein
MNPSKLTGADFIRATPGKAKDVVAKARQAGLKLSVAYVYSVRTMDKRRLASLRPVTPRFAWPRDPRSGRRTEDLLRAVAAEIGLARSLEVLEAQRQLLARALGVMSA